MPARMMISLQDDHGTLRHYSGKRVSTFSSRKDVVETLADILLTNKISLVNGDTISIFFREED